MPAATRHLAPPRKSWREGSMSYRLEITTAVLLACAIGVGIWAANRKPSTPDFDFRKSTYLSGPNGSKGLHEILLALGRLSERRRTPLKTLATERAHRPAILVLLDPVLELEDDEVEQVVRYVRAGGAVLAVGDGGGVTSCAGWRTQQVRFGDSIGVRALETDAQLPATHRVLTVVPAKSSAARGSLQKLRKGAGEDAPGPDLCATLAPFAADTVVVALNNRPAILRLRYRGGGTVTLAADRRWFTNRAWRDTDVPVALLPLLTPRPERPGRVAWDEYHQGFGFGNQGSFAGHTWSWLHSTPAGWAIVQLIAVALAWLAMTSVRFGPALSVIERRRRSPLEHLEALERRATAPFDHRQRGTEAHRRHREPGKRDGDQLHDRPPRGCAVQPAPGVAGERPLIAEPEPLMVLVPRDAPGPFGPRRKQRQQGDGDVGIAPCAVREPAAIGGKRNGAATTIPQPEDRRAIVQRHDDGVGGKRRQRGTQVGPGSVLIGALPELLERSPRCA